ncbi:hypothetical protein [Caldimonas brevitalea]|uniref:Uncharacterized protein n=1 Tax=Caldimonas brevitalea TaxID=413882 RepID=A0A0G3BR62_9BURK|nr:hypothetical protein [Caldimonas brevitalea]AKJ31912.1 hypothetical protein AAW51_5221 [Caldimonas brevitalea]
MSFTAEELYESLGNTPRFRGRIHWATRPVFAGLHGHLYLFRQRRAITDAQLAATTHRSGDVEVCLMRMDGIPMIYVSHGGVAAATVFVPDRESGIERFEWVAHTHPLEMGTAQERIAQGATAADRTALERIHERWGQTRSTIVVCRAGRVVRAVPFAIERDGRMPPGTGQLWRPSD